MRSLGTFVGRVALHGALTGMIAGTAVAIAIVWLADALARENEDRYLLDVCEQFALELREREADPIWLTKDEAWELEHTGIRVASFEKRHLIAGDPTLKPIAPGRCVDQGRLRVCARRAFALTAMVGREQPSFTERNGDLLHAAWIAVLLACLLSAVSAQFIARVVVRPLRELRDAVAQLTPGHDELGVPAGVSEVDALRVALRETLAKLSASLAQSERFARDAAHELRTPLTAIIGELELIAERAQGAEREDVMRVHAIALRQQKLVERLLVLAQQRAGQTPERVDLVDVVETAVEGLCPSARERVAVVLPQRETFVEGDSTLLVSMVGNALDNALKFAGGHVQCTLEAHEHGARIAVQDDGPGIEEQERERVFLPFYRSPAARGSGVRGHGIGLALIAHVAALHGGAVRFARATQGARLEIDLPRLGAA
ncbi:MAG TPA: HAMP domain-containing sensor histidine kinase [Polyangiales bacterium]